MSLPRRLSAIVFAGETNNLAGQAAEQMRASRTRLEELRQAGRSRP